MTTGTPTARTTGAPGAGLLLGLLGAALALGSLFVSLVTLAATWDGGTARDVLLVVLGAAGCAAVVAGTAGMGVGGIAARLEARTAPLLPERARWLSLGAATAVAAALVGGIPWAPAHALGVLLGGSYDAERHVVLALGSSLLWPPWIAAGVIARRQGRALAARAPAGLASVSKLDRVPSAAWLALLVGSLAALPSGLFAAVAVGEPDAAPFVVGSCLVGGVVAGTFGLLGRAGFFGSIGREDAGSPALVATAAAFGPVWAAPYLVALVAGSWTGADEDVHGARLFLAVLSAAAMVLAVALVAWGRAEPARPGADAR